MYGARMAAAVGAAAVLIGISGCAGVSTEFADSARQDSTALRVEARSASGAAEAQGDRLAELADALAGGTAAETQGDRLSAYAEAAGGETLDSDGETLNSVAAHQGARLSAYAAALAGTAE